MGKYQEKPFVRTGKNEWTDPTTGKKAEGRMVLCPPPREKCHSPFCRLYAAGAMLLGTKPTLPAAAHQLMWLILGSLQYENVVGVSQSELVALSGLRRQHVSRAVNLLVKRRILEEIPHAGRQKQYRMNAFIGWRGSMKSEREFLAGETANFKSEPSGEDG